MNMRDEIVNIRKSFIVSSPSYPSDRLRDVYNTIENILRLNRNFFLASRHGIEKQIYKKILIKRTRCIGRLVKRMAMTRICACLTFIGNFIVSTVNGFYLVLSSFHPRFIAYNIRSETLTNTEIEWREWIHTEKLTFLRTARLVQWHRTLPITAFCARRFLEWTHLESLVNAFFSSNCKRGMSWIEEEAHISSSSEIDKKSECFCTATYIATN